MALQLQLQTTVKNGVFQYPFGNRKKSFFSSTSHSYKNPEDNGGNCRNWGSWWSWWCILIQCIEKLDQLWSKICSASTVVEETQKVVSSVPGSFKDSEHVGNSQEMFDVIVCGGTLGIFIAAALSSKGLRVGIVERNVLKGREQEWNISRKELLELVEVDILTEDDIEEATAASFNPNRCGFEGKGDIWVQGILNLGVSPVKLVEIVK